MIQTALLSIKIHITKQFNNKKAQGVMPIIWYWVRIVLFIGLVVVGSILLSKTFVPNPEVVQANITQSIRNVRGLA